MHLKEYLAKTKQSQDEFAKLIGLSQPYINQLVNHERLPSLKVAAKIRVITGGKVIESDWIADSNN